MVELRIRNEFTCVTCAAWGSSSHEEYIFSQCLIGSSFVERYQGYRFTSMPVSALLRHRGSERDCSVRPTNQHTYHP
eukprot:6172701-Pleurochrysis_carterae.AAC.2